MRVMRTISRMNIGGPVTQVVLLREELPARAAALGLAQAVVFAGWRPGLARVYADLDTAVISSDNDGTPATQIETMATGCPVASRVGGVPNLIGAGETGRLMPRGDREALTAALLAIFREQERMAALGWQHVRSGLRRGELWSTLIASTGSYSPPRVIRASQVDRYWGAADA